MNSTGDKTPNAGAFNDSVPCPQFAERRCGIGDFVFEEIVDEYADAVAGLANRLLGYPGEVDDVVQDVFLAAFKGLGKFRGQCSIKTWLFTITINKCRTRRHRRKLTIDARRLVERRSEQPDEGSISDETFLAVRKAIGRLSAKYREPIVLKYIEQLSTTEVTGVLGISENTLNVRLSRARKKLKDQLAGLVREYP